MVFDFDFDFEFGFGFGFGLSNFFIIELGWWVLTSGSRPISFNMNVNSFRSSLALRSQSY